MSTTHTNREEARLKATGVLATASQAETDEESAARQAAEAKADSVKRLDATVATATAKLAALAAAKAECEAKLASSDLSEEERKLTTEQIQQIPVSAAQLAADRVAAAAELARALDELAAAQKAMAEAARTADLVREPILRRLYAQERALERKRETAPVAKRAHERRQRQNGTLVGAQK